MENVSRRSAMRAATAGAVAVGTAVLGGAAAGDEPKAPKLWTLEGELKVHPKFIYRYYIVLLDGQKWHCTGPTTAANRTNWPASTSRTSCGCAACWGPHTIPADQGEPVPVSPGVDAVHGCP